MPAHIKGKTRLIEVLACGGSIAKASRESGTPYPSAYRFAKSDAGAEAVRKARQALLGRALGVLASGAVRAAKALVDALESPDFDISEHRVKVARAILGELGSLSERVDVLDRLDRLELREGPHGIGA